MNRPSEDEAWRAIVENYGARAELDDDRAVDQRTDPRPDHDADHDEPGPDDAAETTGSEPAGAASPVVPGDHAYDVPRGGVAGDDRPSDADDPFPSEDLADPAVDESVSAGRGRPDLEERFVPPTPPPLGYVAPPRLAAWIGVLGVPLVLVVLLVVGAPPPSWLMMLMIAWFLGGFAYLVKSMPTQRSDPGDDGARV